MTGDKVTVAVISPLFHFVNTSVATAICSTYCQLHADKTAYHRRISVQFILCDFAQIQAAATI
jgi:hypothetical protein